MNYSFNLSIAEKYGLGEAVFLQNIAFWMFQNKANNTNFYDGRYWTFNSQKAFTELFPFWTRQNLRRVIESCKEKDLILTGNYNKLPYDRTIWYTLSDQGLSLFDNRIATCIGENQPGPWLETTKTVVGINQPIPDNKPDNKQKIKDKIKAQPKKQVAVVSSENVVLPDWLPNELWEEFKQHRKQIKKPMSELAQKKSIKKLDKMRAEGQDIVQVIETSIANGWQGLFESKSQTYGKGDVHGKDSKYIGKNGKFDGTQYLIDKIRARESRENNSIPESYLPVESSECLRI